MQSVAIQEGGIPPRDSGGETFEGYIGKQELARRLGRTVRSVDTYMALGIVPYYKLGRTVAFRWSEVDEHIRTHCRVGVRRRSFRREA